MSKIARASRRSFLIASAGCARLLYSEDERSVERIRVTDGGLQPQAVVDSMGVVHLIYLSGDPAAADICYVRRAVGGDQFSPPIRVNSRPGSAIALGTVRGAHLALGKSDRIHVAWNGSSTADPKGPRNSPPMLYTRLRDDKNGFEPQRNVMTAASGLDGGGTLAADTEGNVYVAWHAPGRQNGKTLDGEGHRRVWLARSTDDGKTFEGEAPVSPEMTGACGCCGMGALAAEGGNLYMLYRGARETIHRDMYLLTSRDRGNTFQSIDLHPWQISACPMSTVSLVSGQGRVLLAWETEKQVYFAAFDTRGRNVGTPITAPGESNNRKHPAVAINRTGETLLVWTEGTGWKRRGSLAWQLFDRAGRIGNAGSSSDLPAWDFATAVALNNRFLVIA